MAASNANPMQSRLDSGPGYNIDIVNPSAPVSASIHPEALSGSSTAAVHYTPVFDPVLMSLSAPGPVEAERLDFVTPVEAEQLDSIPPVEAEADCARPDSVAQVEAERHVSVDTEVTPSGNTSPGEKKKCHRATNSNQIYGVVEGVKRGAHPWIVIRSTKLRSPETDTSKAVHRFACCMEDIVIRAERTAVETSCWLFVAGQQPNATGQFIHYTSPRLRREAKSDVQDLINQFHVLITGLRNARRKDALEMGKQLAKVTQIADAAETEARAARYALEEKTAALSEKDAQIARYKSMLGL